MHFLTYACGISFPPLPFIYKRGENTMNAKSINTLMGLIIGIFLISFPARGMDEEIQELNGARNSPGEINKIIMDSQRKELRENAKASTKLSQTSQNMRREQVLKNARGYGTPKSPHDWQNQ